MILSSLILLPILGALVTYSLRRVRLVRASALAFSLLSLILSIFAYTRLLVGDLKLVEGPYNWIKGFSGITYYLALDGLSAPLILITGFLSLLVVLGSWDLIKFKEPLYYSLILFFEGVMFGVFLAQNLLLFFIFYELVLIPMFLFIGIWGGPRRKYAALKFLIFTAVGSAFLLLAFISLWIFSSTLNLDELKVPYWLQLWASLATLIGFGVKLPIVPLHTWLPDAHVEAPSPISVFLAGLLLKMGGYGFIRVNLTLFPEASKDLSWIFIFFGLLTMFYGALVAMVQRDLKRMIALTSINHMGYVLLGSFTGNTLGLSGAIFQMFNHAALIGLLFMLSGYIHEQAGTRDLNILRGMKKIMPRTSILLILGSMAAMGFPSFSSFLSEFMVIYGALSLNPLYSIAIAVPLITVGYFMWMMRRAIFTLPLPNSHTHDLSKFSFTHLTLYLLPLIIFLAFPWLILNVIDTFSLKLIGGR
ncbi:NAD(P)H-quinone oxidoreductase chain 4 1 [archaeon HR06]|nr:NAD(P)H-quinone oxidoreductase chain 4 1 [archaeon HR06]